MRLGKILPHDNISDTEVINVQQDVHCAWSHQRKMVLVKLRYFSLWYLVITKHF